MLPRMPCDAGMRGSGAGHRAAGCRSPVADADKSASFEFSSSHRFNACRSRTHSTIAATNPRSIRSCRRRRIIRRAHALPCRHDDGILTAIASRNARPAPSSDRGNGRNGPHKKQKTAAGAQSEQVTFTECRRANPEKSPFPIRTLNRFLHPIAAQNVAFSAKPRPAKASAPSRRPAAAGARNSGPDSGSHLSNARTFPSNHQENDHHGSFRHCRIQA